ncbi:MAG TPA: polysaccharide deacetylase family protein [Candidatus Acidoferrum sp.]|jgi:peptidoglycan/xylan/chitin deacetylase (PgdA/CDA1 family)|nr:polysaccharide deacetylase family protein [Candidatus Acidoferrum sp.]
MARRQFAIVAKVTVVFLAAFASANALPRPPATRSPTFTASAASSPGPILVRLPTTLAATAGPPKGLTKTIYLTFDDGPNPTWTPEILSLLEDSGAQASFFVIGENAKSWPKLVEREARDGDTIGDHTWSHPNLTQLSATVVWAELARDKNLITELTGTEPSLWRPPYEAFNPAVLAIASGLAMKMQLWSVDTGDWQLPGTEVIVLRVMVALHNGMVVLLHDGGGDTRSQTVAAVAILIPELQAAGYRLAALPPQGVAR